MKLFTLGMGLLALVVGLAGPGSGQPNKNKNVDQAQKEKAQQKQKQQNDTEKEKSRSSAEKGQKNAEKGQKNAESTPSQAIAILIPCSGSRATGIIRFVQKGEAVEITGEINGLRPGQHGFHIHQYGDPSAPDASSAGGHFNPTDMPHGGPTAEKRHAGDLGNVQADQTGRAIVNMTDTEISLSGPRSIIGRSIIVHAGADDLKSQPAGNAGPRISCGVIGIANPKTDAMKE